MSNHWKLSGIPHKGWTLIDVIDVREDGEAECDTDYETCMMCGNEKIRYVHVVSHEDINEDYRVGCVCAEKMTSDYINPKRRENDLRNRASRRLTWADKKWSTSKKGNTYLKKDEHLLTIFKDGKSDKYKCSIDKLFGSVTYDSIRAAKIGLFNKVEEMKDKGKW
jgi:hypothetical protein